MNKYCTLLTILLLHFLAASLCLAQGQWKTTDWENITPSDEIVVAMTTQNGTGTSFALPNDGGTTTPIAIAMTFDNGSLEFENDHTEEQLIWNIDIANGKLYPAGATSKWLYTIKANDGVRIGTNTNNGHVWNIDGNYLKTNDSQDDRWLGVYSPTDGVPSWRAYKSTTTVLAQQTITFYKKSHSNPNVVATPSFTPNGGSFLLPQTVTIVCETPDATIYYTTDGSDPTTASTVYQAPIQINATTTLKAMAAASGYGNSEIASALFAIPDLISIAEARGINNGETACVEGVVTFIDNDDLYIQDSSAAIVLRTNSSTIPNHLVTGDKVRCIGTKHTDSGLVTLSEIDASLQSALLIVSNGQALPLAVKTIAEINNDFALHNLLQATRISIEHAFIGNINYDGVTVMTQNGDSLSLYQIPYVDGLETGDEITVIGVLGCNNMPQMLVNSASDISFTHIPKISATPTSIAGLDYYENHGPSDIVHFYLAGSHLTGSVRIFPSEHFEVSTFGDDFFSPENPAIVIPPSSGNFSGIRIYARLKADLPIGSYQESLTVSSPNVDTVYVSLSGNVTDGSALEGQYVRITHLNALKPGSQVILAARFNDDSTRYCALSNTLASGKLTGTPFTSQRLSNAEILPDSITNNENPYTWTIDRNEGLYTFTNSDGASIGYNSGANFTMNGDHTTWVIAPGVSGNTSMVPDHAAFTITNASINTRAFALNNSNNCGPYSTSNLNMSGYNFFIDFFVKHETGTTPTVATPAFHPDGGIYYEAQTVSMTCNTAGSTIHYTLDGEDPTPASPAYAQPIIIDTNTTLKAIACKDEWQNSAMATASYTIMDGYLIVFDQDWENGMNGWTFVNVTGNAQWEIADEENHYAYIYGADAGENEDWCISPAFDLNVCDNPILRFKSAKSHTGTNLKVFFSNDYDESSPVNATWTPLNATVSSGGWNWTESGDIDLSDFHGTNCRIGFKYTCTASNASAWGLDDCLLIGQPATSAVAAVPAILEGFSYVLDNGPSEAQQFTVSGNNLDSDMVITETSHYEISLLSGNDFSAQSHITLPVTGGNVSATPIYVRLKSNLGIGHYDNEAIVIHAENADSLSVICNGEVTEAPSVEDWRHIVSAEQLSDGCRVMFAARCDTNNVSAYAVMKAEASGKPEGTLCNSSIIAGDELLPNAIALHAEEYYWNVHNNGDTFCFTNAAGDTIGYSGSGTNFANGSDNSLWNIEPNTSNGNAMIPCHTAFNIINTAFSRGIAMNSEQHFGAYATSNLNASNYNFFIDIFMQSEAVTAITATPDSIEALDYLEGQGPSEAQTYQLLATNLIGNGVIAVSADSDFEISLDGSSYSNTLEIPFADGIITGQPIIVSVRMKSGLNAGVHHGSISHQGGGANCTVMLSGEVIADENPHIVEAVIPLYIQGNNGSNNKRIPYAFRLTLSNLHPNATYRYINQMVDGGDGATASGVGNVVFASGDDFYRTTNPSLENDGSYGVFTTDNDGNYSGWFISESTGNIRFTPGNSIFMRLRLNDGHDGTAAQHFLTTDDYATVINFGEEQEPYQGTAVRGISGNSPKDFVFLFNNTQGEGRPIYGTSIETTGIDYANISQYAAFYRNEVAGNNGHWGAIIPNVNANGIRHIAIHDLDSGELVDSYTSADGLWGTANTVNPSGGTHEVIVINLIGLSIDNQDEKQITIGNFGHEIRINNSSPEAFRMTVYNTLGQPMMTHDIRGNSSVQIPHNLPSGLFVVTLRNAQTSVTRKIMIR
ncbi:MAG: chitobiase/beta-hexosaminidase C-terminal domain-containing protein [Candidatus Limimorpha sp.]